MHSMWILTAKRLVFVRTRSHLKNTIQARGCELRERENAGRKRAQVHPLRCSEHVFSRRRSDLVAQRAAAQGIFEMASRHRDRFLAQSAKLGVADWRNAQVSRGWQTIRNLERL
jgi:hypothetical protein